MVEQPTVTSIFKGLLLASSIAIGCCSVGFALYSLSEWMTSGRLYTGSRSTSAWRTYEQDPKGFAISAVFCVALAVMPVWYFISKRRELFGDDDTKS